MKRVVLSGILALVACNGSQLSTPPEPDPVSTVRGTIVSTDGGLVANARVRINETVTSTDPFGRYALTVPVIGAPVDLWVDADGYSSGHRKLRQGATEADLAVLPQKSAVVDAVNGGTVTGDDGIIISFPEGAFVRSNGAEVVGPVTVSWSLLNRPDQIAAAPGNMIAADGGNEFSLESFGMAEVTISQGGVELELAAPAELQIPLASTAEFMHGDEVALWHFDEDAGVWSQEGDGVVEGRMFVAQVPHFSWWNCDQPMRTTCIEGTVVTSTGQPLTRGSVVSQGIDYMGSAASQLTEESNGSFRVGVRNDSVAGLSLSTGWGSPEDWFVQDWVGAEFATNEAVTGMQNCTPIGTVVAWNLYEDNDGDEWTPWEGDCNDGDPAIYPGADSPLCATADMDCDGILNENPGDDGDGDGVPFCDDCDDTNPAVYPNAPQLCDGAPDNDCDGLVDPAEDDLDADGLSICEGDCDDTIAGAAASCLLSQVQVDARGGCGVRGDGRLHCWGALTPAGLPVEPIASVAVDAQKVCVSSLLGDVQCFAGGDPWTVPYAGLHGLDGFGERMAGVDPSTGGVRFLASTQSTDAPAGNIARIAVGAEHVCVERFDGTVACDGGPYAAPGGGYSDVVSGDGFSCALSEQGEVACWGVSVPSGQPAGAFTSLAAGASHVCALDGVGAVTCWGSNASAQLASPEGPFSSITAGGDTTCGVWGGASVLCWGANDLGQAEPFGSP